MLRIAPIDRTPVLFRSRNLTVGKVLSMGYKFRHTYGEGLMFEKRNRNYYFEYLRNNVSVAWDGMNKIIAGLDLRLKYCMELPVGEG